jgi:hypothetical protein
MEYIIVAQDKGKWRLVVNTNEYSDPIKCGEFLN